jgi:hypothetical protein
MQNLMNLQMNYAILAIQGHYVSNVIYLILVKINLLLLQLNSNVGIVISK